MTAAQVGLPVILVTGSQGRAKVAEVVVVAMMEVPLAARFLVLRCPRRAWRESCGEKKWPWTQVNAASFLRISGSSELAKATKRLECCCKCLLSAPSFKEVTHWFQQLR
jgi:hypothetical protein